ncbi:DUF3280 domain-containing protein [Phyllobacterium zundukense]|uniref:DUF3280 domain-containing protein n=1 Tax=Phyllobacterium zundukense TaxID=1867719 RepID=A0ACD4D4G6_9HYPH|nr:DUF3280 domain-containing protein [Phyllobacterium zundukense]UXN60692.1 DUF3280 domain-containing protein [Phyllobacterium zundukense]
MTVHASFAAVVLGAVMAVLPARAESTVPVAVANFDFLDTSGEPVDQSDAHKRRLKALSDFLRDRLAASGKLRLVTLPCEASQCTAADPGFEPLARQARQAGARFVVIGAVEKTSTLIGWVKYSVLNVEDQRAICGELITYRGDTDEILAPRSEVFGGTDRQPLPIRRVITARSL